MKDDDFKGIMTIFHKLEHTNISNLDIVIKKEFIKPSR